MTTTVLRPHFSLIREAESLVFVSGQMAFDSEQRICVGGVADQTRQCLRNIEHALAKEGLGLSDVVKATVWLANVDDFPSFNQAYAAAFLDSVAPARSTVRADLMVKGALVEIEAIAIRRRLT